MKGEGERYSCKGKGRETEGEKEVVPGQILLSGLAHKTFYPMRL